MTDQRELDRLLGAFFVEGTDELADRVVDAALDQIGHTRQRRAVRMPWRLSTPKMLIRVAAVAVIVVLAVSGALYLIGPGRPAVAGPSPTPGASSSLSEPASPSVRPPSPSVRPPSPSIRLPSPSVRLPTWTATGNMITARADHTATLLPDGKVLVAGGNDFVGSNFVGFLPASAELYDPSSGSWTATGTMVTPRTGHTATLLPDGKVLVAGGAGGSGSDGGWATSAELYDPSGGSWTATGTMVSPRQWHTATLLPDGKVLVAGGWGGVLGLPLASAELYDPSSGSWTATGNMITARADHTATLLPDGKVLVAGGDKQASPTAMVVAAAELYDPSSGSWTATGSMGMARRGHTATLLPDGKVLVAGGSIISSATGALAAAELYDPSSGSWTATGSMGSARGGHTATLLPDGKVLVAGGWGSRPISFELANTATAAAELYDPGSGTR